MSLPCPDYIKGYEKVLAAYGFWPEFPNTPARLIRVGEDRIDLELKPYPISKDVKADSHPYYRYRTVFSFTDLLSVNVHAFGADNIIFELSFSTSEYVRENGSFIVDLDSAMGCNMGGHLRAKSGQVLVAEDISNQTAPTNE